MKKVYFAIGIMAALAAFSCSVKEDPSDTGIEGQEQKEEAGEPGDNERPEIEGEGLLLSFTGVIETTKADIDFATGAPAWEDADEVLVYVAETGDTGKYVYDASEGEFCPADASNAVPLAAGQTLYVYYPYADSFVPSGASATFTLPAEFDGLMKAPMAATLSVSDLSDVEVQFKNLGAILHVCLQGSETVTAVELSSSDVALSGAATVTWTGGIPVLSTSGSGMTAKSVGNVHLSAAGENFSFLLPPSQSGQMSGMSLKFIFGKTVDAVTYEPYETRTRNSALTYDRNDLIHLEFPVGFFSGGDGSETYPYLISSVADFQAIATNMADETAGGPLGFVTDNGTFFGSAGVHYLQTADLDFQNETLTPIGNSTKRFYGNYDGDGKKMSNIEMGTSSTNYMGVFGYLQTGEVKNICLEDAQIVGRTPVGGVVGYLNYGKVTNCTSTGGFVKGDNANIGGIVGRAYGGTVSGCSITGVTVSEYATAAGNNYGGIVGYVDDQELTVENCHVDATSSIHNNSNRGQVGGIVGGSGITGANKLLIDNCTNAATITSGTSGIVGGIIGTIQHGVVSHCSNTGTISSGGQLAGGIAGRVIGGAEIYACWSNAEVSAAADKNQAGGIVGWLDWGVISCCHAKGSVTGASYVGGIVGRAITGANITDGSSIKGHRVLIHECLAQADVTSTGATAGAGGVIGMLQANYYDNNGTNTIEYAMVSHCVGWKATVTNTAASNLVRFGAFIGYVATNKGSLSTNSRCFTENCYTALEDGDLVWADTDATKSGGYVGWLNRGNLKNSFYRISNNTQEAEVDKNNCWLNNFTQFPGASDSDFCASLLATGGLDVRTTAMNVNNNSGKTYIGSAWTTTGYNNETLPLPLPQDLVDLGPEFYQ